MNTPATAPMATATPAIRAVGKPSLFAEVSPVGAEVGSAGVSVGAAVGSVGASVGAVVGSTGVSVGVGSGVTTASSGK